MCGIVGIVDPNLDQNRMKSKLCQMNDQIVHRGPNDAGAIAANGIGIGMRRLSIIDVAGGKQPISNETGDIHVVGNGEIYNFVELRENLISQGHRFSTGSDVEVIAHLYEEHGDDCFRYLRGMYAIAIWDQKKDRMLVCRDRLGQKPLFYSVRNGKFMLASEMKSMLAADPSLTEPNNRLLAHFFQFGFIPEPHTIYKGIDRLPAGHYGVFEKGSFSIKPYWELNFEPDHRRSENDWMEELDQTLLDSVKIRLQSEVPLGVFLSGGLDSSAIVAYANAAGLNPMKTFTIGFDRDEWDESPDAKRVADHFGTDHHVLKLTESQMRTSFEDTLHAIIRHCDEPFGDPSAIPTYFVSKIAKEHVTVILSGDGGDELFAGYNSYRGALFAERYRQWVPSLLGKSLLPNAVRMGAKFLPNNLKYKAQRIAGILSDSSKPFARAYRDKITTWPISAVERLLQPDLFLESEFVGEQYFSDELWKVFNSDRDTASRLSEIDIRLDMRDGILVKVDRMSMAHSLEVRSPLLDHNVAELAAKMPTNMKIKNGRGKHVLRKLLEKRLPAGATKKSKQGFCVPLREWFKGDLRELVRDTLTSEDGLSSSIFQKSTIESILTEHETGVQDHSKKIWFLMTYASWNSQYQKGELPSPGQSSVSLSTDRSTVAPRTLQEKSCVS